MHQNEHAHEAKRRQQVIRPVQLLTEFHDQYQCYRPRDRHCPERHGTIYAQDQQECRSYPRNSGLFSKKPEYRIQESDMQTADSKYMGSPVTAKIILHILIHTVSIAEQDAAEQSLSLVCLTLICLGLICPSLSGISPSDISICPYSTAAQSRYKIISELEYLSPDQPCDACILFYDPDRSCR